MNREPTKKSIAFANWYNSYVVVLFLVRGGSRPLLAGRGYVSKDRGEATRDPSPSHFFSNLDELHIVSRVRDGKVKANGRSQEM